MTDIATGPQPSLGKQEGLVLLPHSNFPHPDIRIAVDVSIEQESIALRYQVSGAVDEVLLPPPVSPARADKLWERTCFEAFIRPCDGDEYLEFNFAPSRLWAMYRFDRYRENMRAVTDIAVPRIGSAVRADFYELHPMIYPRIGLADCGLSAVIEAKDGTKSYWALAHPPGKPDFHNRDCFTARLAAPTRP